MISSDVRTCSKRDEVQRFCCSGGFLKDEAGKDFECPSTLSCQTYLRFVKRSKGVFVGLEGASV
eukprot:5075186-Amphidinium_carterae.1